MPVDNERPYDIVSTLRDGGATYNTNRKRVLSWTKDFVRTHDITSAHFGEVTTSHSGSNWDMTYMQHLNKAKIIVTSNPGTWEGDYRLWESMLSGALVFVDHMTTMPLLPYPLLHERHCVFYNISDRAGFNKLLLHYWTHPLEARAIARAGHARVIRHHFPVNRVDYVLSKVEFPQVQQQALSQDLPTISLPGVEGGEVNALPAV
jgi:hypothetical protein